MRLPSTVTITLMLVAGLLTSCREELPPPNILWISVEDISPHLGSYGDSLANTPRLDALAAHGVVYSNAFTVAGVCAPSRSSIITGMYPTSLGTHHMRTTGRLPEEIKGFPAYLRNAGYYTTNNVKTDYNFKRTDDVWDQSSSDAHWRNRPNPSQPFFAVFNLTTTHESRIAEDDRYATATAQLEDHDFANPEVLNLPPYYPDTPIARKDWSRLYNVIAAMDLQVGEILAELENDGLAENTVVLFFSDHGNGLPRAKRWVYDSGIKVPLIVYAPPAYKHLLPQDAGHVEDELVSLLDLGPTMLNIAEVPVPPHMQGNVFMGANRSPERAYIYAARDRMDERYDIIRAVRDEQFKYIRNYEPHKPYFPYMNTPEKGALMQDIRRHAEAGTLPSAAAPWFTTTTKPDEELYDLSTDPHELNNLAYDDQYENVLKRMREAQANWATQTRDVGLIPEPYIRYIEQQNDAPIFDLTSDSLQFPMKQIQYVAALPRKGNDAIPELTTALQDEHPAIRYWAATGLGILKSDNHQATERLLELLNDETPVVRVTAAWALGRASLTADALPTLASSLQSDAEWLRLYAALALDDLDTQARSAIPALEQALSDQNKYVVRVVNHTLNRFKGTTHVVP